jgi:DNA anti-recombination protein RmuC
MNQTDQAIVHAANFTCVALTILVNCLKSQGALGESQFENALQATLSAEGPDRARLDYEFLKNLLKSLRRNEPGRASTTVPLN